MSSYLTKGVNSSLTPPLEEPPSSRSPSSRFVLNLNDSTPLTIRFSAPVGRKMYYNQTGKSAPLRSRVPPPTATNPPPNRLCRKPPSAGGSGTWARCGCGQSGAALRPAWPVRPLRPRPPLGSPQGGRPGRASPARLAPPQRHAPNRHSHPESRAEARDDRQVGKEVRSR